MNVIVSNEQYSQLINLDVDVIKSVRGLYSVNDLEMMFGNFFYNKLILDVTALKDYRSYHTFELLVSKFDISKIIFYIPEGNAICTPSFFSKLIDLGIYNFTTNLQGIKYLLTKSNTFNDVAYIKNMVSSAPASSQAAPVVNDSDDIGISVIHETQPSIKSFKLGLVNLTEHAGSTSLIYMMKKELVSSLGESNVLAIEMNKNDFQFYNDDMMVSANAGNISNILSSHSSVQVVLIDLNNYDDLTICDDILYIMESGTLNLNKLIRKDRNIFMKLKGKKIVLNKSLLDSKDASELEYEARTKFYYNLPPMNDRKHNDVLVLLLSKLNLIQLPNNDSDKIFGLFRR